ncbi:MAG: exonuclease subunit SbcD, partial [Deltaproteobacteria bacterium]|nr:exonuclease subunit SbcD [Deltaproteobacteria bacterium]
MKILHTADWHLGHSLHEQGREEEHTAFLDWLLELVGREKVDALLVAGDVFDSANPSAAAQTLWYGFLAELCKKHPQVGVVVIAGNHDSAARLEAPEPLLRRFGIHVVGEVSRLDGEPELERLVVPLRRWSGEVAARVVALPFLRPADLTWVEEEEQGDPLVEGVRRLYARAIEEARRQRADGEA